MSSFVPSENPQKEKKTFWGHANRIPFPARSVWKHTVRQHRRRDSSLHISSGGGQLENGVRENTFPPHHLRMSERKAMIAIGASALLLVAPHVPPLSRLFKNIRNWFFPPKYTREEKQLLCDLMLLSSIMKEVFQVSVGEEVIRKFKCITNVSGHQESVHQHVAKSCFALIPKLEEALCQNSEDILRFLTNKYNCDNDFSALSVKLRDRLSPFFWNPTMIQDGMGAHRRKCTLITQNQEEVGEEALDTEEVGTEAPDMGDMEEEDPQREGTSLDRVRTMLRMILQHTQLLSNGVCNTTSERNHPPVNSFLEYGSVEHVKRTTNELDIQGSCLTQQLQEDDDIYEVPLLVLLIGVPCRLLDLAMKNSPLICQRIQDSFKWNKRSETKQMFEKAMEEEVQVFLSDHKTSITFFDLSSEQRVVLNAMHGMERFSQHLNNYVHSI
uniref:Uncharacterized protein n=1 Tax=Palpitomonas bilix TaxID=652834 RepID=A0A7S3DJQ0_9EUKA|mmetsp:Transcript_40079/g.103748  ORF Transcript_40079/g.103748 Transcript_40079/m.103748 type:complete len:441 (+) Transcript_40079:686-2008(+)